MKKEKIIELFFLKCAVIENNLKSLNEHSNIKASNLKDFLGNDLEKYLLQFEADNRDKAAKMSLYYQIFYMLENDIRKLISETLEAAHGNNWWNSKVPQVVKEEAQKNIEREEISGVSLRSEYEIDYTTFGQLGDIIKANYEDFAGILRNLASVNRVLYNLNMLRGTIAHCGVLADDEVERLKLAIKDWFRVLEGPRSQ